VWARLGALDGALDALGDCDGNVVGFVEVVGLGGLHRKEASDECSMGRRT